MKRITLIPPEEWLPAYRQFVPGERPDVYAIYDHLRRDHGIAIEFLDPRPWPWNPLARMHPVYRGLDPARTFRVLTRLRQADAILSVFESSPTLLLLLRKLCGFHPPVGMWDIAPDDEWWIRARVQGLVVPRVDRIMTLSTWQTSYIEQRWGAGSKAIAIGQHVDTAFYTPSTIPVTAEDPILAIGDDHGRDWNLFVEAVAPLDINVILKTRKEIRWPEGARCRVRHIRERISFPELRALYAQCAFVVVPLKTTLNVSGVGSILEAMAMGKAVVMNANPPVMDYVSADETALVAPVGDVVAFRECIQRLVMQPSLAATLGAAGRHRAESLYAPRAFAARMGHELHQLMALRRC